MGRYATHPSRGTDVRPLRAWLQKLKKDSSGNATLLLTIGMPMLVGSAGLAVDVAQWYAWKNEVQYAVDQAAIAGAWARTDDATKDNYVTRARQEFTANVSSASTIVNTPSVTLANYSGGSANSVVVSAAATTTLPFTGFMMKRGITISVSAQAQFNSGSAYTSCIIATDPNADGSITIGGSSVLTASCGLAALSTSAQSIVVSGSPDIDAGWVISKGGIDDWFNLNSNDVVQEYMSGLYDPYAALSPPTSPGNRSYNCQNPQTLTYATVNSTTSVSYAYWKGPNSNNSVAYPSYGTPPSGSTTTNPTTNNTLVTNGTVEGGTSYTSSDQWTYVSGNSQNTIWLVKTTRTDYTYTNINIVYDPGQASLTPGTYNNGFRVSCPTVLSSGVYIIDGGGVDIDGQHQVTGNGIMFVLKNGAYIKINGGTSINLSGMSASQLVNSGYTQAQANLMDGMMIFEDRNSAGSNKTVLNGNTGTVLNGTMYFPSSVIDFTGSATVTSRCLMIAAKGIKISGSANMSTFCPAGMVEDTAVSTAQQGVKLVS